MTRENCAFYPQVTQGVKMCSQFVLWGIRKGKKTSPKYALVYLYLFPVCFLLCVIQIFTFFSIFKVHFNTYVCSGAMVILTGLRVTSNQQLNTRHSIKKKPIQFNKLHQITRTKRECEHWHRNYWSWGNWQDQQQASVLHMVCHFHSFHKENTKSVISKISI